MYKNKPVIIANRPFWRHPIFPWGWYSLIADFHKIKVYRIKAEGVYRPHDTGGGLFYWFDRPTEADTNGTIIKGD